MFLHITSTSPPELSQNRGCRCNPVRPVLHVSQSGVFTGPTRGPGKRMCWTLYNANQVSVKHPYRSSVTAASLFRPTNFGFLAKQTDSVNVGANFRRNQRNKQQPSKVFFECLKCCDPFTISSAREDPTVKHKNSSKSFYLHSVEQHIL